MSLQDVSINASRHFTSPAVALGAFAVFATAAAAKVYSMRAQKVEGIPQPPGAHWFWGHLPEVRKNVGRMWDWMADSAEQYCDERGVLQFTRMGKPPTFIITNPKDLEFFFQTGFENFTKRLPEYDEDRLSDEIFGHGIFAVDGPEWRRQRKLYSYTFSLKNLREHMFSTFETLADKLIAKIDRFAETGETFDLQNMFARLTIEGICSIAFAQDLGCIEADETPAFVTAFDLSQFYTSQRGRDPFWKLKRYFQIGEREQDMTKQCKILDDFCYEMIDKIRANDYDTKKFNIVRLALDRAAQSGMELTNENLKDIAMSFCIAGRDTTACAMSWIVLELCRHPEVLQKVLAELEETGGKTDYRTIAQEMPYLESVFLESLRMHPSVPADSKLVAKDCTFPSGLRAKRGQMIGFHPYVVSRNTRVWGEDAREFKPERFADGDKQYGEFMYPIFNAGPRLCLGKAMATLESKYVLARLLKRYEFELDETEKPAGEYIVSILLWMKNGLMVKAKRRE